LVLVAVVHPRQALGAAALAAVLVTKMITPLHPEVLTRLLWEMLESVTAAVAIPIL
jgi:hypothetical protein